MKSQSWKIATVFVGIVGVGCFQTLPKNQKTHLQSLSSPGLKIVKPPESQTKEVGTLAQFTVLATPAGLAKYQWKKNGADLPGATNNSITITNVSFGDVAEYSVRVHLMAATNELSSKAYLSVYELYTTNSNGGTLSCPVGLFSPMSYTCGGVAYSKGYTPQTRVGPYLFYGPFAWPQSGPFMNTSGSRYVSVNTAHVDNGWIQSGISFHKSFPQYPTEIQCRSTASGMPGAAVGPIPLNLYSGIYSNVYRATLYYISPPPSGRVTMNWLYHN